MKLAPEVLLEIVAIVQNGLVYGKDVSEQLRCLDLVAKADESTATDKQDAEIKLFLTDTYRETREMFR